MVDSLTLDRPHADGSVARPSGQGYSPRYTVDDYENLPDDGRRYEIVDGDLFMTPAPSTWHQEVSRNLEFILFSWARRHRSGRVFDAPIDVELGPHDILQPDIVFVSTKRRSIVKPKRIVGAPDLVIEILSSSTRERDQGVKHKTYARFGIREYWIVDPDEMTVAVYAFGERGPDVPPTLFTEAAILTSGLLPGFSAPLAQIFERYELE